jgi:hypothetical protein
LHNYGELRIMNIIEKKLDNGYQVKAFENSVSIIDEIWVKKIYEKTLS